jgi:Excalibur calcium-binding domain
MAYIRNFDKSRRTHWRSNDDLQRIHRNLPWNQKPAIQWGLVATVLIGSAAITQFVIWERQAIETRSTLLSTIPFDTVFAGCGEVRERGLAPLHRGDPGYGEHMDGDGDGVACEPYWGAQTIRTWIGGRKSHRRRRRH